MAIGDSITVGETALIGGWRNPLYKTYSGVHFVGRNISVGFHEGYDGFRIDQLVTTVLPVIDSYAPSLVLLIAGTNDISQGETGADTYTEIMAFAAQIKAKVSVDYVLIGTIPYYYLNHTQEAAYNALLVGTMSPPAGTQIIDCSSTLVYPGDFEIASPVHPNTAGYAKMAAAWAPAVAALL